MMLAFLAAFATELAYAASGCHSSQQIANIVAALDTCNPVRQEYMVLVSNWCSVPTHRPVVACVGKGEVQAVYEYKMKAVDAVAFVTQTVQIVDANTPLHIPFVLKNGYMRGGDNFYCSETCLVLNTNEPKCWVQSPIDNSVSRALDGNDTGRIGVFILDNSGSHYIWRITLIAARQAITLQEQSGGIITLAWDSLLTPPIVNPRLTANYILRPTCICAQTTWTDVMTNHAKVATIDAGPGQTLAPNTEHFDGKPLSTVRHLQWFHFGSATTTSPYLTAISTLPPLPVNPPYNADRDHLLDTLFNDQSLMSALNTPPTRDLFIVVAARKSFIATYEVIFKSNNVHYKSTATFVDSFADDNKSTLYVIDARRHKSYIVNLDGRYIHVRGSANCVNQTNPHNNTTASSKNPILTEHEIILMGVITGSPLKYSELGPTDQQTIKAMSSVTIKVTAGYFQCITNHSHHLKSFVQGCLRLCSSDHGAMLQHI
jgi:hypothetical protein